MFLVELLLQGANRPGSTCMAPTSACAGFLTKHKAMDKGSACPPTAASEQQTNRKTSNKCYPK